MFSKTRTSGVPRFWHNGNRAPNAETLETLARLGRRIRSAGSRRLRLALAQHAADPEAADHGSDASCRASGAPTPREGARTARRARQPALEPGQTRRRRL